MAPPFFGRLNAPSVATTYYADTSDQRRMQITKLDNAIADSEIAMTSTDDGRLKSINQNTTGQGEAVAKAAISLIGAVAGVAWIEARPNEPRANDAVRVARP